MIRSLGWGTFLLWGLFDIVIAALAFLFLKETQGLSLETIAQQHFTKGGTSSSVAGSASETVVHAKQTTETVEEGP